MTTPSAGRAGFSSHVLDTALGKPAAGVAVRLEIAEPGEGQGAVTARGSAGGWTVLGEEKTDADGRVRDLLAGRPLEARRYRVTFETGAYFRAAGRPVFYPRVQIELAVTAPAEHHHIPLLLSPFGYSTYRGS